MDYWQAFWRLFLILVSLWVVSKVAGALVSLAVFVVAVILAVIAVFWHLHRLKKKPTDS